jgi:geranylgeranyl diphosphate synthase type II
LDQQAKLVNGILGRLLASAGPVYSDLQRPLRYVLEGRGKRVRGALVLWCCEIVSGGVNHNAEIAAGAVEMVHAYSLVHDDLPAMDDDDFRRGRPTCHKAFDEATAILTGDALLALAFEVLAKEIDDAVIAVKLIGRLAESAGAAGMIAGQMADLKSENMKGHREKLEYIHTNKTAKMFQCAALMGAITGHADAGQLRAMSEYGLKIGLGFQISDDILDVCGSTEQLGKTAGKDARVGKMTYPSVVGRRESNTICEELAAEAVAIASQFGESGEVLQKLALALSERTK